MDESEAVRIAEPAEAEFMHAMARLAPPEVQHELGMAQARLGGGVALVMSKDPTGGYWNKALGFGVSEPVTGDLVSEVLDFYRSHGGQGAVIQVAPSVLPGDWDDICAREGIVTGSAWVKLLRDAGPAAPATTDLRVAEVGPSEARAWAEVMCRGFGMPLGPLVDMVAGVVGPDSPFVPYAAWDGDRLVAAANLMLAGDVGAFCGAATLPEARGRGAQSAFFEHRVARAVRAGCRWLSAETWKPTAEAPHNPSLANMRRAGFDVAYERTNWTWHA
jgi:GNAT superfamily N-acetyltransferase